MKLHLAELRRRGIFKALAAYAVASWVLVEVVSIIAPAFLLPPWTVAAVATVFVLGAFPVLLLAWRYELTDAGLARDESLVPDEVDRSARTLATVFLLGLLGATSLLWVNYFRAQPEETVHSLTEAQRGAPEIDADGLIRSIAVLPFEFGLTPTTSLF
jgi:hypothetical protein